MDVLSQAERSKRMSLIRAKNTRPEMAVRGMLSKLKIRYRGHRVDLPGRPEFTFVDPSIAGIVHGCFWHGHTNCQNARLPKTRRDYWLPKIRGNIARDRKSIRQLKSQGWRVFVAWECETKHK